MKSLHVVLGATVATLSLVSAAQAAQLAPGTELVVAPADELSSRDLKKGDLFDITVSADVVQNGSVVIPRGTPGHARVSWKTGKSVYGKSGKFEFDLVDLRLPGGVVPISGHYRIEGRGETGVTIAVTVIGGLAAGAVVVGHDAVANPGTRWAARTAAPIAVSDPDGSQFASTSAGVRLSSYVPTGADPYRAGRDAARAALAVSGQGEP